jgi:fructose transport system ATP-binding protein
MRGITKSFGHIQALRGVDIDLWPREIVGLVGDNGAGKSTLIKILTGALESDDGEIRLDGAKVAIEKPADAQALGIAAIYQDLALFDNLSLAENIFAGREMTRPVCGVRFLRRRRMNFAARDVMARLEVMNLGSPRTLVENLSGGQRQMVAAARAMGFNARVLILDEPTAALGVRESAALLDRVCKLRDAGLAIILITHRLPDVLAIGSRVVVLKGGQVQGVLEPSSCTIDDVVTLIVRGRDDGTS